MKRGIANELQTAKLDAAIAENLEELGFWSESR